MPFKNDILALSYLKDHVKNHITLVVNKS